MGTITQLYLTNENNGPAYLLKMLVKSTAPYYYGHGHWVNVLALNTDYVMRTAAFEPSKAQIVHEENPKQTEDNLKKEALARFNKVLSNVQHELMVSGSDDFKLM